MAIIGVALNMNRPADQAMYDANRIHTAKTKDAGPINRDGFLGSRFLNPRHKDAKPIPNENKNTSGPKVREQLSTTGCLRFSNGSENLVLGEVESTGCQNVPTVGEFPTLGGCRVYRAEPWKYLNP